MAFLLCRKGVGRVRNVYAIVMKLCFFIIKKKTKTLL